MDCHSLGNLVLAIVLVLCVYRVGQKWIVFKSLQLLYINIMTQKVVPFHIPNFSILY